MLLESLDVNGLAADVAYLRECLDRAAAHALRLNAGGILDALCRATSAIDRIESALEDDDDLETV